MTTINKEEIQKFSKLADEWWDVNGKFKPLHRFNPIRIEYILEEIMRHFQLDREKKLLLKNLEILDIGCGGGLISEPMARLGGNVTGIDAGAKNIIVTMGANGSFLSNLSGSQFFASSKVKAVDSTAAGDCFNGALATLLSQGHSLPNSISFANRAAAVSVTRMGAQTSLPFVDEVKD